MKSIKKQIKITMVLGAMSLVAGLFSHLALTDIGHGEPNVAAEWMVVQAAALIILAFIIMALLTLRRALKLVP